jgi:hypothetical protein
LEQHEMEIDWNQVKKQTLWSYDDLVKKLKTTLAYEFVQEHYNHTMKEAREYALKVQAGYLQDRGDTIFIEKIGANFDRLEDLQVKTYLDLIEQVDSREKCEIFIRQTGLGFDELIQTLNYLFRLVLPFKFPLRELIDADNEPQKGYFEILKRERIGSNLDILERGRTRKGRRHLSEATDIPESFNIALVHKADISRMAYVRGKTILHLCGGGYDTLDKIANANLEEMEKAMDAYYRTLGKSLANFQAVIPLTWIIGGAQILPRVVDLE